MKVLGKMLLMMILKFTKIQAFILFRKCIFGKASEGVQTESSSSLFMVKCWKPQLNFEYEKNPDFHQTNAQKIQSHTQTPQNYLNF